MMVKLLKHICITRPPWVKTWIGNYIPHKIMYVITCPCPILLSAKLVHDDVIKWKPFIRVTGHLCGEFTGPGEFPSQRPVTRSFDVFFDLCLNKQLSKHTWGGWFETPSCPLWRHSDEKGLQRSKSVGITYSILRYITTALLITTMCVDNPSRHTWVQTSELVQIPRRIQYFVAQHAYNYDHRVFYSARFIVIAYDPNTNAE